jgi:AraC-like DNA-binding protein
VDDYHCYLPVRDETIDWGLFVTSVGRARIPASTSYPPVGHPALYDFDWRRGRVLPEFAIVLVTDGSGQFDSAATGLTEFDGPAVIMLLPGAWHRYRPLPETGWLERWVCFNGEMAHRLFASRMLDAGQRVLPVLRPAMLVQRFDEMLQRVRSNPADNSSLLSLGAIALAFDVVTAAAEAPSQRPALSSTSDRVDDPVVRKAIEIVWTQSHRSISVNEIAQQLPVTRRTLDRRFAAATGHNVLDEINLCRVSRAKRLLAETALPIKMVAYLAGFTSDARMRRTFAVIEGTAPSDFRRRVRGPDRS